MPLPATDKELDTSEGVASSSIQVTASYSDLESQQQTITSRCEITPPPEITTGIPLPSSGTPTKESESIASSFEAYRPTKDFGFLPIPKYLQYRPDKPRQLSMWTTCGLSFVSSFSTLLSCCPIVNLNCLAQSLVIANVYYCQPLLSEPNFSFVKIGLSMPF